MAETINWSATFDAVLGPRIVASGTQTIGAGLVESTGRADVASQSAAGTDRGSALDGFVSGDDLGVDPNDVGHFSAYPWAESDWSCCRVGSRVRSRRANAAICRRAYSRAPSMISPTDCTTTPSDIVVIFCLRCVIHVGTKVPGDQGLP